LAHPTRRANPRSPSRRRLLRSLVLAALVGVSVLARAAAMPSAPAQVSISNFAFDPHSLSVPVGSTVVWINRDDEPHTVTSAAFTSQALDTDESFSFRFDSPGTYVYRCAIHPQMTGTIVVH